MKYCYKCGSKMEDDDLFCGSCGAEQYKKESEGEMPPKHENIDLKDVFKCLSNMFVKPVASGEEFISKDSRNSTIAMSIILFLFSGILGAWRVQQVISSIQNLVANFYNIINSFSSIMGSRNSSMQNSDISEYYSKVKQYIHIPYGSVFIQNIIAFIIIIVIMFIALYLGISIVDKNKVNTLRVYNTALISTIPFLYFKTLSIIVSYASNYAGIIIELIGIIVCIGTFVLLIKNIFSIDDSKILFIVSAAVLFIIILASLCIDQFIKSDIRSIIQGFMQGSNFNL